MSNFKIGGSAFVNGITMINSTTGFAAKATRNKDGSVTILGFSLFNKLQTFNKTPLGKMIIKVPVLREMIKFVFMMMITILSLFKGNPQDLSKKKYVQVTVIKLIIFCIVLGTLIFAPITIQLSLIIALCCILRKKIVQVFKYHGAEHKCIAMYEDLGYLPENIEIAMQYSRVHNRCGTNLVAILVPLVLLFYIVLEFLPTYLWANSMIQLLIQLLIIGIGLELLKKFQKTKKSFILKPGMFIQKYITTKEPDLAHLEVAYKALEAVLNN